MPKDNRASIEMRFADGEPITAWESFSLRQNYLDPLDSLSFSVANVLPVQRDKYLRLLRKGEEVTLWCDGAQQATAVITTVTGSISRDGGWRLQLECESTLHAAYNGSVDPYYSKNLKEDTPVVDVVLEVLAPYGFTSVVSDTSADVAAVSGKSIFGRKTPVPLTEAKLKDYQSPQQGNVSAYQWCASLFTRFGLVLRTNRKGELLLGAPDFEQPAVYTVEHDQKRFYGGDQMLAPQWRDTNQNQFSHIVVRGEKADSPGATSASPPLGGVKVPGYTIPADTPFKNAVYEDLREGRHNYRGGTRHPYKPKFWLDKKGRDQERCLSFARSMAAARGQSGFEVTCSVDGLISKTGRVWAVDTVGRVVIAPLELDESMYLIETTKKADRAGGQMTMLKWVPLYSLDLRST